MRPCCSSNRRNFSGVVASGTSSPLRSIPMNSRIAWLSYSAFSSASSAGVYHCCRKYTSATCAARRWADGRPCRSSESAIRSALLAVPTAPPHSSQRGTARAASCASCRTTRHWQSSSCFMAAASPLADQGAIVARLDKSAVRSWGRFRVGGPRAARGGRQLLAEWSRLAFANERPVCTSLLTYGSSWRCARHGSDIEPIEVVIHPLSCLPPPNFLRPDALSGTCNRGGALHFHAHGAVPHTCSAPEPSRPDRATAGNPTV